MLELRETSDGSHTLYVPELNETYHSTFGAVQESLHVFIGNGLDFWVKNNPGKTAVSVFEMGFGTGLNALLTYDYAIKNNLELYYAAIEKFPISSEWVDKLNFTKLHDLSRYDQVFSRMHRCLWNEPFDFQRFILHKICDDIKTFSFDRYYDIVFFDAFAPSVVPELWSVDVFRKINEAMNRNGVLTTYSSKGEVKRNLLSAGFSIERLQGPPGKRHMLRAIAM
ncbi:MAG TPA: tRNA (5-methylaminomethyl-2-thiouridine)(34)-methyltransferase MnmD [Salinivirgaceae bacterium]|mgnify:CR=1 FL=1|nr:tRNA (5-methylaminomethyl-2-thiouridine)(34)-methyltransferase MnmD [Salinivirgaceae bacterium]